MARWCGSTPRSAWRRARDRRMFVHRRDVQIQWGDCDPANIVYYPRYFEMFDDSTSILFEAAGFSKQDIIKKYGLVGIPMVDTRAKFHSAGRTTPGRSSTAEIGSRAGGDHCEVHARLTRPTASPKEGAELSIGL